MEREYWYERLNDAMFAYRAEDYSGRNFTNGSIPEFLSREIRYSAVREYANSLPKGGLLVEGVKLTRSKILSLLPKGKRTSPASLSAIIKKAKKQKSFR